MNQTAVGHWAFIIGIIVAVLAGFAAIPYMPVILFVLGLIVGFLNIAGQEKTPFLVAAIALLLIGTAGLQLDLGAYTEQITTMLTSFVALVSAAALVVAIRQVLVLGRPRA